MKKLLFIITLLTTLAAEAKNCDLSIILPVDLDRISLYDQKYLLKMQNHFAEKGYNFKTYYEYFPENAPTKYAAEFLVLGWEGFNARISLTFVNNETKQEFRTERKKLGQKSEKIYSRLTKQIPPCGEF